MKALLKKSARTPVLPASLDGQQIAVWGFGLEGQATAEYLQEYWSKAQVTVFCSDKEQADYAQTHPAVRWQWSTEPVTATALNRFDWVIKSPGISPYQSPADQVSVPMVTSAALWFAYHRQGRVCAVTGTKGKSTTASLLAHVLQGLGFSVNLTGNIGKPLLQSVGQAAQWTVLETSSYQAADGRIAADLALLLNLFPEHLDWHGSEARYYQDKLRLLESAQMPLLGAPLADFSHRLHAAGIKVPEQLETTPSPRWRVVENQLQDNGTPVFSTADWALAGAHNLQNLAAVLHAVETLCEGDQQAVSQALQLARGFQPLPHRLQRLGRWQQREWINDSIASTPHATLAALATVNPQHTTLIVGGYDRELDWQEFVRRIGDRPLACLIITGETRPRILQALQTAGYAQPVFIANDLAEAVQLARKHTPTGGTVLLSPGAPSFDAFANYAERGEAFAQLAKGNSNPAMNDQTIQGETC